MTPTPLTSYDEVPYESKPLFATHPDCLAVAARLRGLAAPLASRCRVLELGCAAGGNLIPLAYALPDSRFVGVDLSQRQISDGQKICAQLQLTNIDLRAASIADVDKSWGQFDYVICHGVFSWVPAPIRDHILWICRNLLAPAGVAYVSYNTYPGWRLRSVVRDLMKYHTARFDDPATKVQQARSILSFMASASASLDSPMSRMLAEEAESLPQAADYYLYHEHLEDSNQPLYFHQFVGQARSAGLEYLGEAWHHTQIDNLPAEVQETLQAISRDLIDLEQFVDFIRSRTFRRTLLCHQEAQFVQSPNPAVMDPLYLTALARPAAAAPDIASDRAEKFILDGGAAATTNMAPLKAALVELFQRWPTAVPFSELVAAVSQRLHVPVEQRDDLRPLLASLLVRSYVSHLVAVHCEPFRFVQTISEHPRASALARLLAATQANVPSLRHRLVPLSPAERVVLQLADGAHTREQIAAAAGEQWTHTANADPNSAVPKSDLPNFVASCLERFARSSLLAA